MSILSSHSLLSCSEAKLTSSLRRGLFAKTPEEDVSGLTNFGFLLVPQLDRKVWLTPGKGRTPRFFRVNHVAFHHVQRCLELALELGVVGHLEDALLLQLLIQLTQLTHVLIQLCLAVTLHSSIEFGLEVVVEVVVGG